MLLHVAVSMLLGATVTGLDHVPVAVRDLEAAAATYRRLGFVLKPGRPHANGIRNFHAKFADGTELELITAPAATDSLTTAYRRHLESGDGPAFLALYAPSGRPEIEAPPYVFFGTRNASPTDRPEHFAHPNGARSLIAVWLAGDLAPERVMLEKAGARMAVREVSVPDTVRATVARLPEGEMLLLPASRRTIRGRPIVGVTLAVDRVQDAKAVLAREGIAAREAGGSLFIPPAAAHGLWIEMREGTEKP